jgi:hypothetical protein
MGWGEGNGDGCTADGQSKLCEILSGHDLDAARLIKSYASYSSFVVTLNTNLSESTHVCLHLQVAGLPRVNPKRKTVVVRKPPRVIVHVAISREDHVFRFRTDLSFDRVAEVKHGWPPGTNEPNNENFPSRLLDHYHNGLNFLWEETIEFYFRSRRDLSWGEMLQRLPSFPYELINSILDFHYFRSR